MEVDTFESLSRLETMPVEIMYEILSNTPFEVLIKVRAASRTLKSYVDKYSMPTVHSVQIVGPGKNSPSSYMKFTITIPESERKKFELRLVHKPPLGLLEGISKDRGWNCQVYCFYFYPECNDTSPLEYLAGCMGTHIRSVELRNSIGPAVSTLFSGKNIAKLTLFGEKLFSEEVNSLLQLCSSNNVAHLDIQVIRFANNDPGSVLLNLATYVPSLRIIHANEWRINKDQLDGQCLFGVPDIDWAPIILDMFGRNIERLCITNQWEFGYLSRESCDMIIEKLPLLEKKFWFETSCGQYDEGVNYERSGCTIRADSNCNRSSIRRLTIFN